MPLPTRRVPIIAGSVDHKSHPSGPIALRGGERPVIIVPGCDEVGGPRSRSRDVGLREDAPIGTP